MKKVKNKEEIISFEYNTSLISATDPPLEILETSSSNNIYEVSDSVKMKYLGDENKDIFLTCKINYRYRTAYGTTFSSSIYFEYNYNISCYLNDVSKLNEGNYCIQIVKKLFYDITSENYCSDIYTFRVAKRANIPVLTVKGFSEDQNGCVQPDETVTLLANINNRNNNTNNYGYITVFLSNTEIYTDDILIDCLIEEQQNSFRMNYCLL